MAMSWVYFLRVYENWVDFSLFDFCRCWFAFYDWANCKRDIRCQTNWIIHRCMWHTNKVLSSFLTVLKGDTHTHKQHEHFYNKQCVCDQLLFSFWCCSQRANATKRNLMPSETECERETIESTYKHTKRKREKVREREIEQQKNQNAKKRIRSEKLI